MSTVCLCAVYEGIVRSIFRIVRFGVFVYTSGHWTLSGEILWCVYRVDQKK